MKRDNGDDALVQIVGGEADSHVTPVHLGRSLVIETVSRRRRAPSQAGSSACSDTKLSPKVACWLRQFPSERVPPGEGQLGGAARLDSPGKRGREANGR
jgi:hypothetical protein